MRTKPREAVHSTQSSESYAPSSQNIKQGEHRKVIYSLHNQLAPWSQHAESIFLWILLVVSRSMRGHHLLRAPSIRAAVRLRPFSSTSSSSSSSAASSSTPDDRKEKRREIQRQILERRRQRQTFTEASVPSSPMARISTIGGAAAGVAFGAATELAKRGLGMGGADQQGHPAMSEANAERLAQMLCRMRGAALKFGQLLSIQDVDVLPPAVAAAFEKVRSQAHIMPRGQLERSLADAWGPNWASEGPIDTFEYDPLAAASIGQVHKATLKDGREIAVKVQYPGVAESIDSDLANLEVRGGGGGGGGKVCVVCGEECWRVMGWKRAG